MTGTVDVGLFRLEDPPAGGVDFVRDTLAQVAFPWWRMLPWLRRDAQGAVIVRWGSDFTAFGRYWGHGRLEINNRFFTHGSRENMIFTLVHEMGHMIDGATLDDETRQRLLDAMHVQPTSWHGSAHRELWRAPKSQVLYQDRINEAFADQFVAAFAPTVWNDRQPRFSHWTDDHQLIRTIVLEAPVTLYADVDPENPHCDNIGRAHELGLMEGVTEDRFDPHAPVTRAQLATTLVRLHDQVTAGGDG